MTLEVRITKAGGEPKDFISVMCPLFIPLTAYLALSSAGRASPRAISAFSLRSAAAAAERLVCSSMLAAFYSTSAMADSFPTIAISSSVSCFL